MQPPADSGAAMKDERQPLLPARIQQGSLSTKQLFVSFIQRGEKKEKDCHMAASLICGLIVPWCDVSKLISMGLGEILHSQNKLCVEI